MIRRPTSSVTIPTVRSGPGIIRTVKNQGNWCLGDTLRRRRLAVGRTQEQVAEALEVGQTAVSQWERDVTVPTMHHLLALAQLYGISVAEVVAEAGGPA